jgi:hypothetical protein
LSRVTPARVRSLRAKQQSIVRRIKALDREIRELERTTGRKAGSGRSSGGVVMRKPNARRLNDVTVSQAIHDLLREKKKPMHYKDIADRLQKEGRYRTRSRNFLSTVAITILRDKRIRRVEPGVYALRKR